VERVFGAVLGPHWRERVSALPPAGKPGRGPGCQAGSADEPAEDAYDCLPASDQALATTLVVVWAKALAAFERRLDSRFSAFDAMMTEGPQSTAISESAKRGARLFVGKAGCFDCHNGPLFSDDAFHNVGVPQTGAGVPTSEECVAGSTCDCVAGKNCLPWGAYNGLVWVRDTGPRWWPIIEAWNDDSARRPQPQPREPFDPALKGAWRTPSLRDVALGAPYMHDGAYATLEEVIWHYNRGGRGEGATVVGQPSAALRPLGLDAGEVADLIEFLKTLTGDPLSAALTSPTGLPLHEAMPPGARVAEGMSGEPPATMPDVATTDVETVPANVQSIFDGHCFPCHNPGAMGNLSLKAPGVFARLVGSRVRNPDCSGRVLVVRRDVGASYLVAKLRGGSGICGLTMPPGGVRALSPAEIAEIEAWIGSL
jgi:mono/diheme cytochrome c family protein